MSASTAAAAAARCLLARVQELAPHAYVLVVNNTDAMAQQILDKYMSLFPATERVAVEPGRAPSALLTPFATLEERQRAEGAVREVASVVETVEDLATTLKHVSSGEIMRVPRLLLLQLGVALAAAADGGAAAAQQQQQQLQQQQQQQQSQQLQLQL